METGKTLKRYALSTTLAVATTAGLLWVMQMAIHNDEPKIADSTPAPPIDIFRIIKDEEPEIVKPPVVPDPPPKVPDFNIPAIAIGPTSGHTEIGPVIPVVTEINVTGGAAEGDLLPIMTVPPEYPDRMATRGTEGWVIVEFTVDELGRVVEPRVIDAQPANGFNRAALRAVLRYKYKPRVINGSTVPVSGVRQRIVFNLAA